MLNAQPHIYYSNNSDNSRCFYTSHYTMPHQFLALLSIHQLFNSCKRSTLSKKSLQLATVCGVFERFMLLKFNFDNIV